MLGKAFEGNQCQGIGKNKIGSGFWLSEKQVEFGGGVCKIHQLLNFNLVLYIRGW